MSGRRGSTGRLRSSLALPRQYHAVRLTRVLLNSVGKNSSLNRFRTEQPLKPERIEIGTTTSSVEHLVDNMQAGVGRVPDDATRERMAEELA